MAEEKKVYSRTKGIIEGAVSGFCPGCMHSTIHKLIGEAAEELGQLAKLLRVEGVGCCGLGQFYVTCDETIAAHGRAGAVATGIKRSSPDSLETLSAANRGENFTVIFVNNGIYGMTGGQMAPTTLVGMKSTTTPGGRNPSEHGYPMHMSEIINQLTAPYYIERVSCDTPQHVIAARKAIKKAFQYQLEGKGYSIVEIVTSCPTNWGLDTLKSLDFLREKMFAEYPLGVFRDKGEKLK